MEYTILTKKPRIICLCGSTRFRDEFYRQRLRLELEGNIVLSISGDRQDDYSFFALFNTSYLEEAKAKVLQYFIELHMWKIELADEILVLNVGDYIGAHTNAEIAYALSLDKVVSYLEPYYDKNNI